VNSPWCPTGRTPTADVVLPLSSQTECKLLDVSSFKCHVVHSFFPGLLPRGFAPSESCVGAKPFKRRGERGDCEDLRR